MPFSIWPWCHASFLGWLMVYFPNLVGYYFWWLQVEFCWTALSKEVKKWCWRRIWSKQRKTLFPTVARESLDLILSGKFLLTGTSKIFHNILPASIGIQQVGEPTYGYVEGISQLPNTKYCRVLPSITKYNQVLSSINQYPWNTHARGSCFIGAISSIYRFIGNKHPGWTSDMCWLGSLITTNSLGIYLISHCSICSKELSKL